VDDESVDSSMDIIRKYDRWIDRVVEQKNQGQAKATNRGFSLATGDAMGFINSDDVLEPGALAAMGREFARGADWVVGAVRLFGPSIRERIRAPIPEAGPLTWFGKNPIPQQSSFWASSVSERLGLLREDFRYMFDLEYWLRMRFVAGIHPVLLDEVLAGYRFHGRSKSVSQAEAFLPEIARVRAEYRRYLRPHARIRARMIERSLTARARQGKCLMFAAEGRRWRAIGKLLHSIVSWPPMLFSRRTLGAARRIVVGRVHPPMGDG
jgi:glycosyltransferase involved in cell wall biosynthesis